jgi:hypothetical protein
MPTAAARAAFLTSILPALRRTLTGLFRTHALQVSTDCQLARQRPMASPIVEPTRTVSP